TPFRLRNFQAVAWVFVLTREGRLFAFGFLAPLRTNEILGERAAFFTFLSLLPFLPLLPLLLNGRAQGLRQCEEEILGGNGVQHHYHRAVTVGVGSSLAFA